MRDGLYQVTRDHICAGFVVADGRISDCAPVLRARGFAGSVKRIDEFHRLLVTGSRQWRDVEAIRWALRKVGNKWGCRPDQIVVVQGMAAGADLIARRIAIELGMRYEDHPVTRADWARYGNRAGHRRNAVMVAAGARGCVAFPLGASPGTRGAMKLCQAAGIPVWNRGDRARCGEVTPACDERSVVSSLFDPPVRLDTAGA